MDVRCEKCNTEYELDEARLKPGGVTVKCTNCGHMFKIRKRSPTNVGAAVDPPRQAPRPVARNEDSTDEPTRAGRPVPRADEPAPPPARPAAPRAGRPDSIVGEHPPAPGEPAAERQWLVRLENGEQKSCRELSSLQQWIVAGVVTRESMISRTGKTWKRLGDVAELGQYFVIADEARTKREAKDTGKVAPAKQMPATMLGIGTASAAGGSIVPDDDDTRTGNYAARPRTAPPPPPAAVAPPAPPAPPAAPAAVAPTPPKRPATQPPPPPAKKPPTIPAGNRSTAAWATEGGTPGELKDQSSGPAGPLGGRVKAASADPVFSGRVRVEPGDDSAFTSGKVKALDEDDDVLPERRGSRAGAWVALMLLLVGGAAAAAVYVFIIKDQGAPAPAAAVPADAAVIATVADAAEAATTPDAAPAAPAETAVDVARAELGTDDEARLRTALRSLETVKEPEADAMRANLAAAIAQGLLDRAAISADKAEADKLKKDAKSIVADALGAAQRAAKALPADASAQLAMAHVLRLQGKSTRDVQRYIDAAKAKAAAPWTRDVALAQALLQQREAKLGDARTTLAPLEQGDDRLETSGDVRARMRLALIAYADNQPAEARPLAEQVLAAQPEHAGARALISRIETTVAKTDPLPPEDGPGPGSAAKVDPVAPTGGVEGYDRILVKANQLAESNCTKAMELFSKALEQKPNGVEALTGMGFCHIDAKQFSSAFSKFRAALAVAPRYEPALWGVAEAYVQQGRKEQAIENLKAYLEVYPGTPKATKALDRLGGGAPAGGSGDQGGTTPTPTPPTPDPTPPAPTPTPAPSEGAGTGSG